ncbi:spore germination protein [Ferroacidibacillus organovorans]|uniref:spore germination protein n=1 Tax=Ferroacidibacillus organovorans TaxID=1765683 RepID=UPI001FD097C5|nr:spore germination protein [Ferroacidibacillus organovorans]
MGKGASEQTDAKDASSSKGDARPHTSEGFLHSEKYREHPIFKDIDQNEELLRKQFEKCSDVVFRPFALLGARKALIVYVDGLVDSKELEANILKPLTTAQGASAYGRDATLSTVEKYILPIANIEPIQTLSRTVTIILRWQVMLFVDGEEKALALSVSKWPQRAVTEPETETVIRGPREGFTENVRTSTALIRRRIHTPELKTESMQIGRLTQTQVVLCYIQGLIDDKLVEEVKTRLKRIEIDSVLESGYIEELIEDTPWSPFPQIQNTEKPDVVTALLLEGRFALLIDGTPFALVAPINLWGALASPEDYYERFLISTMIRWLRYTFALIALFLPALYVAITTFHQEFLPFSLLLSVAAARENTPYPAVIEALIMEFTFEAIREAGVRMPKAIGSAISIVGALVIGQAAVQAGIVSAPMVIIVAITGIASFTIPRFNFAIALRMLRFPVIILAGLFGIFGILFATICIVLHICSLRSFGMPYTSPITPLSIPNLKDTLFRAPWWAMRKRPYQSSKANLTRQSTAASPTHRIPGFKKQKEGSE